MGISHKTAEKESKVHRQAYSKGEATQPSLVHEAIVDYADNRRLSLFRSNRMKRVRELSEKHRFFHYELEFIEVFRERGGFDIAVGNPPWIKMQFEEKGIISEAFPEVLIRKTAAPKVRKLQSKFLEYESLRAAYLEEYVEAESTSNFMNAVQNYSLLKGQQTNLYKCIIVNGLQWIGDSGYLGLLHPEGVYDDPGGKPLRRAIYEKLEYHFQFQNGLNLFADIAHREKFSSNIYSQTGKEFSFLSINNVFHPTLIDGCFVHDGSGQCGGIKEYSKNANSFTWNLRPHIDRIVPITPDVLKILSKTFENSEEWESAKLTSIHSKEIIGILDKLSQFEKSISHSDHYISEGWHETNDVNNGIINRNTIFPDTEKYQLIYSGPHFFVSNPLYKSPREVCIEKAHYDIIDLTTTRGSFVPRTNYIPALEISDYKSSFPLFKDKNWASYYKLGFRKMLSQAGERTLIGTILPPKISHTNAITSTCFASSADLLEATGLCSSLVLDFFVKTTGKSNLYEETINSFPLGIDDIYWFPLVVRTLLLNCLNNFYALLWEEMYNEGFVKELWSREDSRLSSFEHLRSEWDSETPLRNFYERRWALIEIDVIVAMALGLSLEELVLIYNVQFPVLQQNEFDTWYDQKGDIVFTCSKGLTGVGLDRAEWNYIKDMTTNEMINCDRYPKMSCRALGQITYTITKSELYQGQEKTYYAPFDKCDRVEDYKVAWAHFEKIFHQKEKSTNS